MRSEYGLTTGWRRMRSSCIAERRCLTVPQMSSREEWQAFVGRLAADRQLEGIQGLGFSKWIPREELAQHIEQVRAEGFPEYTIRPEGERDVYSSIIYLEPFEGRNLRAFGYDMYSEPVRRAAMERARDENTAALSGKVTLVQETNKDVQAGTLMYVPVYKKGMPIDSVEERQAAFEGWVYSPYRMNDLLSNVLGELGIARGQGRCTWGCTTGDGMDPDALLYDSQAWRRARRYPSEQFVLTEPLDFGGQRWTVHCGQSWRPGGDDGLWQGVDRFGGDGRRSAC